MSSCKRTKGRGRDLTVRLLRATVSYHCKVPENPAKAPENPGLPADSAMQSGWDLNLLKTGNEETLKGKKHNVTKYGNGLLCLSRSSGAFRLSAENHVFFLGVKFPIQASSIGFVSKGPTAGLLSVVSEVKPAEQNTEVTVDVQ